MTSDDWQKPYADAGHDVASLFALGSSYNCVKCGAAQIDLSEDLAYGDMRRSKRPLWLDQRRRHVRFEFQNGPAVFDYPALFRPEELDELEQYLAIVIRVLRRNSDAVAALRRQGAASAKPRSIND